MTTRKYTRGDTRTNEGSLGEHSSPGHSLLCPGERPQLSYLRQQEPFKDMPYFVGTVVKRWIGTPYPTTVPPDFDLDNIAKLLWYEEGSSSEVAHRWWVMTGRLKSEIYFHLTTGCDEAGYDLDGTAKIEYSLTIEPFQAKMVPWEDQVRQRRYEE